MLRFSRSDILRADKTSPIVDSAAAKAWLTGMAQPLTVDHLVDIAQVLHTLGALGAEDAPALPAVRKFAIAERIRGALLPTLTGGGVSDDRFKVLPIDDDAGRHFWAAASAAEALRDCYAWLVSLLPKVAVPLDGLDVEPPGAGAASSGPLVVSGIGALHRALDVSAQTMVCIQRAHWTVPTRFWERHCVLGQLVRELDGQDVEVGDVQRLSATRTCRSAFALPLMIALADPASKSGAEYEVVRMAAQRWSQKVGFRLERRSESATMPERPAGTPGPTVVFRGFVVRFDTQNTLQSIDKRLDALGEGRTPREVGIGDSLRAPVARELLLSLRQRWGAKSPADIDSPDRVWRTGANAGKPVLAMIGMPTREAVQNRSNLGRGVQSPYAYQRIQGRAITQSREQIEQARIDQLLVGAEGWTLIAESSDAVRCLRKYGRPRLGLQRLVGLRLGSDDGRTPFLLGWIEALQGTTIIDDDEIRHSSAHAVRVRLAPGLPQVIFAAIDDIELDSAFLLVPGGHPGVRHPAGRVLSFVPMLSDAGLPEALTAEEGDGWDPIRQSPIDYGLVLPQSSFRPRAMVKAVRNGAIAMLCLEELIMRGSDFDLVRFSM